MTPVRLNRKLTLEAPQQLPDGAGGFVETWQPLGELWAEVRAGSARERAGPLVNLSTSGYRITVRAALFNAPSRPKPEQRFREGDRFFRILAVSEKDPDGMYLTCIAKEELVA